MNTSDFTKDDIVEYQSGTTTDRGYVTSTNEFFVFVQFGFDNHSKACSPFQLTILKKAPPRKERSEFSLLWTD